jgi:hypothetical protein
LKGKSGIVDTVNAGLGKKKNTDLDSVLSARILTSLSG